MYVLTLVFVALDLFLSIYFHALYGVALVPCSQALNDQPVGGRGGEGGLDGGEWCG